MKATQRRAFQFGPACCAAAVGLLAGTAVPASAAALPMTLSSVSGPSGGGNTITGTVAATAANPSPFPAGTVPRVQFQYVGTGSTACTAASRPVTQIATTGTATTAGVLTVDPANVTRVLGTMIAFQVPSSPYPATTGEGDAAVPSTVNPTGLVLGAGQPTAKWNVCVYDSTGAALLAQAAYTLAPRPKITSIVPASSPVSGGQLITVNGSGFSTVAKATTATVGGTALNDIKVAANGNSFTAVTPARDPGSGLALVVTTPGGPVSSLDPDNNGQPQDANDATPDVPLPFTYSNGIAITPNTAPVGAAVGIRVRGVGFSQLTFNPGTTGTATDAKAHVFLVQGAYLKATNRGVAECQKVMVVSNTELVCTLDLALPALSPTTSTPTSGPVPEGTYTLTVVSSGAADAANPNPTIVSSGSTFTVAPY